MKRIFLIFILSISTLAFAQRDLKNAPPSFEVSSGKAVYLDFVKTYYNIVYDAQKKQADVYSNISFFQAETGFPIIDLVPKMLSATLNGEQVSFKAHTLPGTSTTVLVANKQLPKGRHNFKIHHKLSDLTQYKSGGIFSAFWMSDLSRRSFLEKYLPSSFEHDHLNLSIRIQILNSNKEHVVMTNGHRKVLENSTWLLTYPKFYTSSLLYLHIFPKESKTLKSEYMQSINGRRIPFTIYTAKSFFPKDLSSAMAQAKKYFNELESLYGPWPHEFFIAYIAGSGGMEYAGATMTSMFALRHEMNHSYFARNVVPARGNSGWIDEAIASWADDHYPRATSARATGVASHSVYRRTTDRNAYGPGSRFLALLDNKFATKGGLKPFLKFYFEKRQKSTVLTKDFQSDMEEFFNADLSQIFHHYIYAKPIISEQHKQFFSKQAHRYHPQYTQRELYQLL